MSIPYFSMEMEWTRYILIAQIPETVTLLCAFEMSYFVVPVRLLSNCSNFFLKFSNFQS